MKSSRFSLLVALAAVVAMSSHASSAQSVRAGIEAWQRSDYAAAVRIWRPLAEKGDSDAAFNLGQAYRLGRGVTIDLAAAQTWLERAARADHLDAQTTLGLLLFDSGSREPALQWLKKAAERGEPRALLVYGTALFNGDGITRNPVLAYAYVSRAAAQGLEPAKSTLEELDRILPVEQRQKGVRIALQEARGKPPAQPAPAAAAPKKQAQAATSSPGQSGRWRIQLGAFSRRSSAEALYSQLSVASAISGRRPFYVPAGPVTRLQVGPFPNRTSAAAACASLTSKGQACFPVEVK